MLAQEQTAALLQDTGLVFSRQWLWVLCQRLDIPRRGKLGPPQTVSPEQKKRTDLNRWRRWYANLPFLNLVGEALNNALPMAS